MNKDKDILLVNRAKNGDQKAFTILYNKHHRSLYHFVCRILNNAVDAEDIMIESYTEAFIKINQFEPRYLFKTWLFKIAKYNCLDLLKKRRVQLVSDNEAGDIIRKQSKDLNPEELLITEQQMEVYNKHLDDLNEYQRDLVELRYYYNFSYKDLAEVKKSKVGTIAANLNRVTALLNKKLTSKK
jgi:RNA polymerase sigma factor (sigma-70 family)